jgi:hypothetical protein
MKSTGKKLSKDMKTRMGRLHGMIREYFPEEAHERYFKALDIVIDRLTWDISFSELCVQVGQVQRDLQAQ